MSSTRQSTNLLDEHKVILTLCTLIDLILIPEERSEESDIG